MSVQTNTLGAWLPESSSADTAWLNCSSTPCERTALRHAACGHMPVRLAVHQLSHGWARRVQLGSAQGAQSLLTRAPLAMCSWHGPRRGHQLLQQALHLPPVQRDVSVVPHVRYALVAEGIVHGSAGVQRVAEHHHPVALLQALVQELHGGC